MKRYSIYYNPKSKNYVVIDNLNQQRSLVLVTKHLLRPNVRTDIPIGDITPSWSICAEIDDIFELPQLPQTHPELFI